jgi:hypothetical protein
LPKPLHGWRAFMGEVGVIVLGVLIALGFGQLADSVHDNIIAGQARGAVRAEVRENLWWLAIREQDEPCIRQRLSELDGLLAHARLGEPVPVVQHLAYLPHAKITTLRWEANAQAGRASLFPSDEQRLLDNMYYTTEQFSQAQSEEAIIWSKIGFIQGLRQFTPADVHDFSIFLSEAHYQDSMVRLSLYRARQWAQRMNLAAANPNSVENLKPSQPQTCQPLTGP